MTEHSGKSNLEEKSICDSRVIESVHGGQEGPGGKNHKAADTGSCLVTFYPHTGGRERRGVRGRGGSGVRL